MYKDMRQMVGEVTQVAKLENSGKSSNQPKDCRRNACSFIVTRFLRDDGADSDGALQFTILAFPYIIMPSVYVQLWIHRASATPSDVQIKLSIFAPIWLSISLPLAIGQPIRDDRYHE